MSERERLSHREMVEVISGPGPMGFSKCAVQMFQEEVDTSGHREKVDELYIDKPIINMFEQPGIVLIDFIYKSSNDADLWEQWQFLSEYYNARNSMDDAKGVMPALVFLIMPKEYDGEYYVIGQNPMFPTLQPSDPLNKDPRVVRMVFREDDVMFMHAEDEDLDRKSLKEEVMNEE